MLKMVNGKLLVKKLNVNHDNNGIVYTNEQRPETFEGTLVAIGDIESGYEIGDQVLFGKFAGEETFVDGEKLILIDEENIWAKRLPNQGA